MSKLEAKELVPELRFPEFSNYPEWKLKTFSKLFEIGGGKDHKHLDSGDIPVYGSGGYMRSVNEYLYDGKSACIGRKGTINKPMFLTGKFWTVDTLFYTHSFKNCLPEFVFLLFQNIDWLKFNEAGGVPSLSKVIINKIEASIPEEEEQQKIVDCFSSMDDLITANTKKLESLKSHKKGLMQKLFPVEGKSVPESRFSGFDSEWVEVELNELGYLVSGLTYTPEDVQDSGLLVLRSSNVQNGQICYEDSVFVSPNIKGANLSKPNDILICVRNGSKALIGKNALIPSNIPLSTHGAFMTIFRSEQAKFVFQLFQTFTYKKQVEADLGATINSINGKQFLKYKFVVPQDNNEKNQIVDFLSSMDSLIKAQSEKIETLKAHKKGLMQRLFPVIEGLAS